MQHQTQKYCFLLYIPTQILLEWKLITLPFKGSLMNNLAQKNQYKRSKVEITRT